MFHMLNTISCHCRVHWVVTHFLCWGQQVASLFAEWNELSLTLSLSSTISSFSLLSTSHRTHALCWPQQIAFSLQSTVAHFLFVEQNKLPLSLRSTVAHFFFVGQDKLASLIMEYNELLFTVSVEQQIPFHSGVQWLIAHFFFVEHKLPLTAYCKSSLNLCWPQVASLPLWSTTSHCFACSMKTGYTIGNKATSCSTFCLSGPSHTALRLLLVQYYTTKQRSQKYLRLDTLLCCLQGST